MRSKLAPVPGALLRPCRALLLDFGGTLDADGVPWKARMRRCYALAGHPVDDERFDQAFHAADDALVSTVGARASLADTVTRLVAGVHRHLGLPAAAPRTPIAARFCEELRGAVRRNAPTLLALGQRYPLAVVSNFYGNLASVCEEIGIAPLFAALIDSTAVGAEKPDARIFQAALRPLGVRAADAVFVGDSLPRDMRGARALGMPHVWLVPAGDAGTGACCPGDPVIHRLGALEAMLP